MYARYFGLCETAFSKSPNPAYFYRDERYEEALLQLQFALEEREMGVIVGPVGSGKTLLTRVFMDLLDERHEVVLIVNPALPPYQFLRAVALELGIASPSRWKADLLGQIQGKLLDLDEQGRCAVLIVDEAHLIPRKAVFDEIRLLTNIQMDTRNLLCVLLVGQTELKLRLRHPSYRSLTQRVGAEYEIQPMDAEATSAYVAHRLRLAGSRRRGVFSPDALEALHEVSGGIPRAINHVATQGLIEAMARGKDRVDADIVRTVAKQRMFEP